MRLFSFFKKNDTKESFAGEQIFLVEPNYTSFLTNQKIPTSEEFKVEKVFISPGKYFRPNQTILSLVSQIHGTGRIHVNLPFGGRLEKIHLDKKNRVKMNEVILSVTKVDSLSELNSAMLEQNSEKLNKTEIGILFDEFTNEKTIQFTKVANEETSFFKLYRNNSKSIYEYLGITFVNHNGYPYLLFQSTTNDFSLAKGDSIILLFEDQEKLEFIFNSSASGSKNLKSNDIPLTSEYLNTFLNKNLLKAKVISKRKNIFDIYLADHQIEDNSLYSSSPQYLSLYEGQYLLKLMTEKFIKINLENKL